MDRKWRSNWTASLIILAILVASFFLRASNLSWETYGYGEVELKEAAESYAKGNFVDNFFIFDTPPFAKYLFAAAIASGTTEIAMRIIPLIFGILTVIATFFLARKLYGNKAGILSAAISGFSILNIQLSRYAQLETMLSFFFVLIAYFLWEMLHENKKYSYIFLGASMGLAFATKFTSIIFIAAVLAYAVYSRHIKASRRPSFSISMNNKILKSLIIGLILFLAVWPFGFARLHTEANVSVNYGGEIRTQQIDADIPIILLSFSRRVFTSAGDSAEGLLGVPILNYVILFFVKESLIMIPLLAAGAYFIIRKPQKPDAMLVVFIATFFVLLSAQRTLITYRHVVPVIPLLSIVASRWIMHVKKEWIYISTISLVLFLYAFLSGPSYALSYNPLKDILGIQDSEFRFNEGVRETIDYLERNCSSAFASNYYRVMIEPYYENIHSTQAKSECAIKGSVNDPFDADSYIEKNSCTPAKAITKNSAKILDIYKCVT